MSMTTMNGRGGSGARACCGDNVRRSLVQTLLVDAGCGGVLGLLPGRVRFYPGSPRLGSADPGLCYAAPLGLAWRGVVGGTGAVVCEKVQGSMKDAWEGFEESENITFTEGRS